MKSRITIFLLLVFLCLSIVACGSGSSLPKDGKWDATSDTLGSFVFNASKDGTAINIVNFTFSGFTCGGVTISGRANSSNQDPSPIADSQFSINTTAAQTDFVINGEFGPGSTNASGSWKAVSEGTVCTGEWEAKPQE